MSNLKKRTYIGLRKTTKGKLAILKAPGQCYDGFLRQLIDLWEKSQSRSVEDAGLAGGNQGAGVFSSTPGLNGL